MVNLDRDVDDDSTRVMIVQLIKEKKKNPGKPQGKKNTTHHLIIPDRSGNVCSCLSRRLYHVIGANGLLVSFKR